MIVRIFVVISFLFVLLLVGSYFLPSTFTVTRSATIKAGHNLVFPYVNNLKKWDLWTAWNKEKDPTLTLHFSAQTEGAGSVQTWEAKDLGNGKLTITESFPLEGVKYDLIMGNKFHINGHIRLTPSDTDTNSTQVEWIQSGSMGSNPIFRYFGMFLDKWLGADMEEGLTKLKTIVEQDAATRQTTSE